MKKWAMIFAAIPLVGWLASLAHNWWMGGEFFYYSDISYLPLIAVTFPFERILSWLSDAFGEHTHRVIFVYALVTSAIYGLVGTGVGYFVRRIRSA